MTNLPSSRSRRKHNRALQLNLFAWQETSAIMGALPFPIAKISRRYRLPVHRAALIVSLAGIGGAHG